MTKPFRVIDTGVRHCREQMAFDQALIETHKQGLIPDTVRFLQFPPSVLVGRHQAISHELNLDACRAAGMDDSLGKPIEPDRLYAALVRVLQARGRPDDDATG